MTIGQIYQLAIDLGTKADPRGVERIKNLLKKEKESFKELAAKKRDLYDEERLVNPFSDSRILFGDSKIKVKRILAGIDIESSEILLADRLSEKGKKIDLVMAHHPDGKALAGLHDVMHLQADLLASYGVPINIAESLLEIRIDEVSRSLSAVNHNEPVDVARILNIPYLCVHTPFDNLGFQYLRKEIEKKQKNLEVVQDLIDFLNGIPEFREASKQKAGPKIFVGKPDRRIGKIALTEVTGGTEGSPKIFEKLASAGIGTVIGMHMREERRQEAEKYHLNVIIAGHMCSDSLGMNLFIDRIEKKGIEIIPCSGFIRVKRKK